MAVSGRVVGQIGVGLVVLVGVASGDGPTDIEYTAGKVRDLRVFADADGRMNRSVLDVGGSVLVVSQFTLLGDVRRGRRPAFDQAAAPEEARRFYEALVDRLRDGGVAVETGMFREHMELTLTNDGPVTILLDSRRTF